MTISTANMLLAASALLFVVSIYLQRRLNSHAPEQRALLIKANPIRMTGKAALLPLIALAFAPYSYKFMVYAVLLLAMGVAMVVQHRRLLRLGGDPTFVNRWIGTSALIFLGGVTFAGALYLGALGPSYSS